jgi:FtsP/CotA-like multicopper oxidase with cupredoxin domain
MKRLKFLVLMSLALAVPFLSWGTADALFLPTDIPDYFGSIPNYANSPTNIQKFQDTLPGLGPTGANNLGQYIPIAVPDTTSFPGSDYYEIGLVRYTEKLHTNLPATPLRGYVQISTAAVPGGQIALTYPADAGGGAILNRSGAPVLAVDNPHYLGPLMIAQKDRPVRVKFTNYLPTGAPGNLPIPVDTTIMGAGTGPLGGNELYTQNRATLHLHGGFTPWISDGTPYQWTAPAGETTSYPKGVSVKYVPDMWFDSNGNRVAAGTPGASNNPGPGSLTFYYTNQQSARLMFYHDHSSGITRLNVYAGEAAGFLLQDPVELALINGGTIGTTPVAAGTIPATEIPLVIQDKTFVDTVNLAAQDPTWAWGATPGTPHAGDFWLPHVYMPNQHPTASSGVNDMGRWDYNTWMYPPITTQIIGPVPNPLAGTVPCVGCPTEPPQNPGTPQPTIVPEGFMDTPLVNGTAYPILNVARKAYRFRILNAANDRTFNLQLHYAATAAGTVCKNGAAAPAQCTEVNMVPAAPTPGFPATWPTDGRDGGAPDPANVGPQMIQIGSEGGFLPAPVIIPNQPVTYEYSRRVIFALNIKDRALLMVPAERADVIIDFSQVPDNSVLMLYNDAPAPAPGFDPRYDYFTGAPDQTAGGGAPTPLAGFGPNTRTIMQIRVSGPADPAFNTAALNAAWPNVYGTAQDPPVVPQAAYGPAFGQVFTDQFLHVSDPALTFVPFGGTTPVSFGTQDKAIIENWDMMYGRMNALFGGALTNLGPQAGVAIPFSYFNPATEYILASNGTLVGSAGDHTQIWRLDHQGVDLHSIHFHLLNVQVINRVALDGTLFAPQPNELGWKESVQMPPALDTIVAVRTKAPVLPWPLPISVRSLDPSLPNGTPMIDSAGNTITNETRNFGYEYVWHCHLLGHEENDMMRPLVFRKPAALDFDIDGVSDFAVYNSTTGVWTINRSAGGPYVGLVPNLLNVTLGGTGYVAVPGDYDGDGNTDVAVYDVVNGWWYFQYSSGGSFFDHIGQGGTGFTAAPGDYDGDGKTDLAVYQPSTGYWYIKYASGAYGFKSLGGPGMIPVQADYDGDGKTDVAVYDVANGWWFFQYSSTGSYAFDGIGVGGGAQWAPVPGDYDGDGKADVAVYDTIAGWWLFHHSTGGYSFDHIGQGGTGFTAVTEDYDGDGKADLAVYQPSTGYWFIHYSSGGYGFMSLGGPGNIPVK